MCIRRTSAYYLQNSHQRRCGAVASPCGPSGVSLGRGITRGPGLSGDSGAFSLGSLAGGLSAFMASVLLSKMVSLRSNSRRKNSFSFSIAVCSGIDPSLCRSSDDTSPYAVT
jgi:hypothetical protein